MNRFLSILVLGLIVNFASAQTTVKRTPFYEVFSSSTCGPCKPANDHLSPIFEEYFEEIAVVKYQMSWPGSGDPYYTPEGNGRRGIYGVTGVPYFVRNGQNESYSGFDEDEVESDLDEDARVSMELRYMINVDEQSVSIRAHVEALDSLHAGAQRMGIIITEKKNVNNVKTNGETEFHNVFKKMLPTSSGDFIIGKVVPGQTFDYDTTYVFQGDYRLPNNANDPINTNIEHSVEDFDNLHVIMFMQSAANDKEIYQADAGERSSSEMDFEREWGEWPLLVEEPTLENSLHVYPNPASEFINVSSLIQDEIHTISLVNIAGQQVKLLRNIGDVNHRVATCDIVSGVYMLTVETDSKTFTERVVLY